jgi:CTP synthase
VLICRTDRHISQELKDKIAMFCNVDTGNVFTSPDCQSIYELPMELHRQGLDERIAEILNIWTRGARLEKWERIVEVIRHPAQGEVRIAIVGKYVDLKESYKSLNEALVHGGIANECRVTLSFVDSQEVETHGAEAMLANCHAVLVPGGFGVRGTEGKIQAVKYAREKKVPFFGICLGLQMAVIEYTRNVLGLAGANSSEFDEQTAHPVVTLMESQVNLKDKGGTMRVGAYKCALKSESLARKLYGHDLVSERHRHRYEVNNVYRSRLAEAGLVFSGVNPELDLVEMIELENHPHFLACQFHPEFQSKPFAPHPLFSGFIRAALAARNAGRGQ